MSTRVDTVVVGAGIDALCAAHLLGAAGWSVAVIEQARQPGGALHTGEHTLPGFKHDFGAMNLGQFVGSPFFKEHGAALARKGVVFRTAAHAYASVFADGRFVGVDTDVEATIGRVARHSPRDAEAWRAWLADFDAAGPALLRLMSSPPPRFHPLTYAFGSGAAGAAEAGPIVGRLLVDSLRETLTARFESEAMRGLVAAWGMHLDFAPDVAGGSLVPFLESNVDQRVGIPVAEGGSGVLTRALAELIADGGGEVRLETAVARILVRDGRAVGVRLAGGEEIHCRRAVIAGVTPPALARLLGDAVPPALTAAARRWQFGPGTMVIHLALDDLPDWAASADARRYFYVHVNSALDQLARTYQQARAGLLPDEPLLVVGQPTAVDPSRAPAGRHTLWVMVRAVPAIVRGDALGHARPASWKDVKEPYADRLIDRLEAYAPGLKSRIRARAVFSPSDLEAVNPNLEGGDLLAGSHHLSQWYGRRPLVGGAGYRMPVRGLYLIGASTWPGAGAAPTSGTLLARQLLARR